MFENILYLFSLYAVIRNLFHALNLMSEVIKSCLHMRIQIYNRNKTILKLSFMSNSR